MNISNGFQLEQPNIFVPWGISDKAFNELLGKNKIRLITKGHYELSCTSLSGLSHKLSFHFKPRVNGVLNELEFYLRDGRGALASFNKLQKHCEATFGTPSKSEHTRRVFPTHSYTWHFKGVRVEHHNLDWSFDRVRIIKT